MVDQAAVRMLSPLSCYLKERGLAFLSITYTDLNPYMDLILECFAPKDGKVVS